MISEFRKELYKAIDNYGLDSSVTLEISQRLDKEIVKEQSIKIKGEWLWKS